MAKKYRTYLVLFILYLSPVIVFSQSDDLANKLKLDTIKFTYDFNNLKMHFKTGAFKTQNSSIDLHEYSTGQELDFQIRGKDTTKWNVTTLTEGDSPSKDFDDDYYEAQVRANLLKKPWISIKELTVYDIIGSFSKIDSLVFDSCVITRSGFSSGTINLNLRRSHVQVLYCGRAQIKKLRSDKDADSIMFADCVFLENSLLLEKKPKVLILADCRFEFNDNLLDFTNMWQRDDSSKCLLRIVRTDCSKLKFNYSEFVIDTSGFSFEQIQVLYKGLKDQYTRLGMMESYKLADIDLIKLTNHHKGGFYLVVDWINRNWWNYGYDKGMVVVNSIYLFLSFLLINLCFGLKRLSFYGYSLPSYTDISNTIGEHKNRIVRRWYRFWYTFLYTSLVFWGINLDKKELKYKHLGYLFYIMFQYLIGVICLAYIAAFILSK